MKKVFLDELPKRGKLIDWKNSIGYKIPFIYDDVEGEIEIIDYNLNSGKLLIKYEKTTINITTYGFSKCKIGKILMRITKEFKINIHTTFKDDKRDIRIIDREYRKKRMKDGSILNEKWYKYYCNKCGNEDWMIEGSLLKHIGCNVCAGKKVILGINSILDKAPFLIALGVSLKDAKKYTPNSYKKINIICPNCGREKNVTISDVYNNKSIGCSCGDGKSYPEKFVFNVLEQLDLDFETEYSPEWANNGKQRRYDFYIPKYNMIIETHGEQHYQDSRRGRKLQEEEQNDCYKKDVAFKNGIENYLVIDCRRSELDWIKQSLLNSKLNTIFDLSKIDFNECAEFANKNIVKEVATWWNNKKDNETTIDLAKIFKLGKNTTIKYLKKAVRLGWCDYNPEKELKKGRIKAIQKTKITCSRCIEVFKNEKSLGVFPSCNELGRQSEYLFGVKLSKSAISKVCNGFNKQHKGFTFKYVNKEDLEVAN